MENTRLHTYNLSLITLTPSRPSFTDNALFYCTLRSPLNSVLPFTDSIFGIWSCCLSGLLFLPLKYIPLPILLQAHQHMWRYSCKAQNRAGITCRVHPVDWYSAIPSLSMTEVPIANTDERGEQRRRTRRNLHLRLVLGIIKNLYWLSAKQKMSRTGTRNRQEQGDISIRCRRFQK